MRRTLSIIGITLAAFGLTACSESEPIAAPTTVTVTVTTQPASPAVAPICKTKVPDTNPTVVPTERKVEVLKPSDACDYTIQVSADGKVMCNPNVGMLEIPVATGEAKGFLGQLKVLRSGDLTRIDWDNLGAHAVIVNDARWGYVDGIADTKTRVTGQSMPLASNLNTEDWGQILKLTACGHGM